MRTDDFARLLAWFGMLGLVGSLLVLSARSAIRWRPTSPHLRKLAHAKVMRKEFRRTLATAILVAAALLLYALYYGPTLFGGSIDNTAWSWILQHQVRAYPVFAWLVLAAISLTLLVVYVVDTRWPRVVSADLWTAALITLEIAAISSLSTILSFGPLEVVLSVVVSIALLFYRAFFDLLRLARNWLGVIWKRVLDYFKVAGLFLALVARNLQSRIVRASQILRAAVKRSEQVLADMPPHPLVTELEGQLGEAELKEAAGDDTVVGKRKTKRGDPE